MPETDEYGFVVCMKKSVTNEKPKKGTPMLQKIDKPVSSVKTPLASCKMVEEGNGRSPRYPFELHFPQLEGLPGHDQADKPDN
jgi:hypothetical protein